VPSVTDWRQAARRIEPDDSRSALDDVAERLRPEHIRRWLAEPKSILPYTAMPAHFPATGPPLGQDIFPGSSREQLDAVAELLIRYDDT